MTDNKEVAAPENGINVSEEKSWEQALEMESWVAPLTDIYETEEDFYLMAVMPGVEKKDVKIKMEEGNLILMGRINYNEIASRKYILKETESGNYYRKFKISNSVDDSKINAVFENGILNIRLPKHERIKPKNIEIK